MEDMKILKWIKDNNGDGSGYSSSYVSGYGFGDGDGYGDDSGYSSSYVSGYGNGSGYGYVSGDGYGDGSGDGSGSGYGYGDGSGDGSGSGFGYGCDHVKSFNGNAVYMVDGIATIITNIKLSLAKGFIVDIDFTTYPCYIAKGDGYFAHGGTAMEAQEALTKKIFEHMNSEEAIEKFIDTFKHGKKYSGRDFFEWHHYLTGSCKMGREAFVKNHNLNLNNLFTVEEFLDMTENDFGGDIIRKLKMRWKSDTMKLKGGVKV